MIKKLLEKNFKYAQLIAHGRYDKREKALKLCIRERIINK